MEKQREKFVTKIWRRVKGIFVVLKPKKRLPSLWVKSDNRTLIVWSGTDDSGYNADVGDAMSTEEDSL